ncbi:2,3-bisphosphoglycerate-independent phosphoglycerate mutase [Dyadobacter sp. BE34]|uniref:2,3-bisphosphoglycerate-independent phosphoglycerate mutase n=1 Tax=Dyadobacter fermentans TaxID=94254 RepID=A0ABU1QQG1_9BACT|nr:MULTISPECIES: 2,3-bisphosphoglycerate-independent phosphoglycerate mutase [Dyadobacter]MDR6803332.1 2,3-bisphosphoglycerate-independent phosphoglycerate mutase [Dyadobacter fermentans]MDR7041073.1 2,3-bisphosphoglycerate-independent phosphoglycerate mutase [Dyadobacter sp. BE242]MDR7195476.1 2,3-bisphosphoglycerate-independent phosphoglycerate mutase [Dyadobacter sp. BE34]MDR7213979.1 2,3-bisphosphoglycerate-independent phosphoglycerate mutase [Dyadobacter sp. BE31]MDR7260883.1 2,3-bisphosp
MSKKVILIIMDGWGIAKVGEENRSAILAANTPFYDSILQKYPHSKLEASGLAVGLPDGQMGNSEVGHTNLGAGRVVYQDLVKINLAVSEGTLAQEPALAQALDYAKAEGKKIHFIGLVSDGGVHSHIDHLKGLCQIAADRGLNDVFVHAFTDGRDTDPKSGLGFLTELTESMAQSTGRIASITGRYYAMDRDKRWERVKLAYDAMVHGEGKHVPAADVLKAVQASYEEGVTDEFITPIIATNADGSPLALIQDGDVVLCFNFRTDRGREITQALTQQDFHEQNMHKLNLKYVTMTNYDDTFKGVDVIFDKDNLNNTLGEVLESAGKKQIRIAETEKYPHVTFFFSGGREKPFEGESRLLCPSPKVATYDLQPEMSAFDIRDAIVPELVKEEVDFVCLNFANPDMVGHTGVFEAAVKACETVDQCVQAVVTTGLEHGYSSIIIADHGNSDYMSNDDGSPNTAHSLNLVPCILVDNEYQKPINNGKLADIAPTILALMGIPQPAEMTGTSIL